MYVSGPNQSSSRGTCENAWSTVLTTLLEVQVMVGTSASDWAFVRKLVLMYMTWSERGVFEARTR